MSYQRTRFQEGRQLLDDIKRQSGCLVCGEDDLDVLDFHHRNPAEKLFNLSGANCAKSEDKLRAEIAKCVVLCANCHRRVHTGAIELPDEGAFHAESTEHYRRRADRAAVILLDEWKDSGPVHGAGGT